MSKIILKLYVSGNTNACLDAADNIKAICEEYIPNNYDLEIIDIQQNPQIAEDQQIMAIPTLIKVEPFPKRRVIGALNMKNRVIIGLGLQANRNN